MLDQQQAVVWKLAERSLAEFIKQAWHVVEPANPYIDNWHIGAIAEHLARGGHAGADQAPADQYSARAREELTG